MECIHDPVSSDTGIAFTDRENIYKGGIDLRRGVIEGRISVHSEGP